MNEELTGKIGEHLDEIMSWVEQGKEFVSEQAPLVVDEIIRWGVVKNVGLSVVFLVMVLCATLYLCRAHRIFKEGKDDEIVFFGSIISLVLGAVGVFGSIAAIEKLAFVLTAPRLYVLEQLGDLISK